MKKKTYIGRERETRSLEWCMEKDEAQFIIVYGRRRVGKTFLIRQFFEDKFDFYVTGIYNQPTEVQLANFATALHTYGGQATAMPKDWMEVFDQLLSHIETLRRKKEKVVVFIDEMPWMDTGRSRFLTALEWFWNGWASAIHNLVFIVCGSATTWITNKLLHNIGGLYNRATCRLYLHPFTLHETEQYLLANNIRWSRYEMVECYMVMGGIPYYLRQIDPAQSYTQNIDRLFFARRAVLWDEFHNLYRTLFSNAETYERIVEALARKRIGLTRTEIAQATELPANGALSTMLENLADSDFIRRYNYYGSRKRDTLYQLTDYYTLFYLHFIKDRHGLDEHFWTNTIDNPARRAWAGYAFEQVCKDHLPQVKRKLGIGAVLSEYSSWFGKNEDDRGAEIDLVIERRDRVINLCEMKFAVKEFVIDKDYDLALRNKIGAFRYATKTGNKALHLTFITTYGVKQGMYSGIVQSQVVMDDLFEEVV